MTKCFFLVSNESDLINIRQDTKIKNWRKDFSSPGSTSSDSLCFPSTLSHLPSQYQSLNKKRHPNQPAATNIINMFLLPTAIATTRYSRIALRRLPSASATSNFGGILAKGQRTMGTTIVEGVEFDTIAREWRCKWSSDDDKKSLAELQTVLNEAKEDIKTIDGLKSVQRVVCGGCLDFKVVIALEGEKFGDWQESSFAPEESFLEKIKKIDGVSVVETQTYTLMPVDL